MNINKYDLFAYQILQYLVTKHHYQVVRVQQHKDDIWLMNATQDTYPVIRISSMSNADTLADTSYIRNVHRVILDLIHREGPIMIFNTNPESTPVDNVVMTQIRITPQGISDERILAIFHDIDHVVHESDDIQKEMVSLSKSVEEAELLQQKDASAKARHRNRPIVTYVWIALCVVISLAAIVFSYYINDQSAGLIASGAYYKMNIVAAYEYWRLFTAGFLHSDPLTLLLNVYALFLVGRVCERSYHKPQYVTILVVSIVIGNLCMLIGNENSIALGVGGGVTGVLGAYLVILIESHAIRLSIVRLSLFKIVWMTMIIALLPGVSLLAMLGGLVSGVLLGILFVINEGWKTLKRHTMIAGALLTVALLYTASQIRLVEPLAKEIDARVVDVYRHTYLNSYGEYLQRSYQQQYRME